jgi:hypothetical protein
MIISEMKDQDKNMIDGIQKAVNKHNYAKIHAKIDEIKSTGKPAILPYLLDLLNSDCPETIKQDVLLLTGDLKNQSCVQILVDYITNRKVGDHLNQLIAACWQSSLDFSNYLEAFAECFVREDYQTALEAFTVIEEMLWRTKASLLLSCREYLLGKSSEIAGEKEALFKELLKILDEGRTASSEEFPDLYAN